MTASDRRQHIRTPMTAKVKVIHDHLGEFVLSTSDISDGGLLIAREDNTFNPQLGDRVAVQVQGVPVPVPVLDMRVVRCTEDSLGLQFENC